MNSMLLGKNTENFEKTPKLIENAENKVVSNLVIKTGLSIDELLKQGAIINTGKWITVNDTGF